MDITEALAPVSDQLDAIELVEPRTFTIAPGSKLGKRDGKTVAEIRFENFDRVWRPSKGMLDVLAACWGTKAEHWVGHQVTVYNDPDVMYGKDKVGGVRISHLSHIDEARSVTIRGAGAGRKKQWPVKPLTHTEPVKAAAKPLPEPSAERVAATTDRTILDQMWQVSGPERREQIEARVFELDTPPTSEQGTLS